MRVIFKFDKEEHIYHIDDKELKEIKEDYDMDDDEFKQFMMPLCVTTNKVEKCKNHYLFGWFESYCQSDSIPHNWWESDNNGSLELIRK